MTLARASGRGQWLVRMAEEAAYEGVGKEYYDDEVYYEEGYEEEGYEEEGYEEEGYEEEGAAYRPPVPPRSTNSKPQEQWQAVALYDFVGENAGELSFAAGDSILIVSQVKDGWYSAVVNGEEGFVPCNYVQLNEDSAYAAEAQPVSDKKAKRQKLFAERKDLKADVEAKRAKRKELEAKLAEMEDSTRERRALIKRVGLPPDQKRFVLNDLVALAIGLEELSKSQDLYDELTGGIMLGLTSIQGQLAKDIKPGNPLEDVKKDFDTAVDAGKLVFTEQGQTLTSLIACRKEYQKLLEQERLAASQELGGIV